LLLCGKRREEQRRKRRRREARGGKEKRNIYLNSMQTSSEIIFCITFSKNN
jgi:hypothetical protein